MLLVSSSQRRLGVAQPNIPELWEVETTQVIRAPRIKESTTAYSFAKRIRQGYGYMCWMPPDEIWGPNAFYASGYGGQIIAIVPSKRLVVVQTVDVNQNSEGIRTNHSLT